MTPLYDRMGRDLSDALDRHITGNYGDDQFVDPRECPACQDEAYPDDEGRWVCDGCGHDLGFDPDPDDTDEEEHPT